MHSAQDQQQRHHYQHWKRTALQSSVKQQQRGNVIVSRKEVTGEFDNEQQSGLVNNGNEETDVPESSSSKNFYTLQPVSFDKYHTYHDESQLAAQNQTDNDSVQLQKTDYCDQKNEETNEKKYTAEETITEATKNFACQYCPKKFKHKSYFNYHMRTHTGERPFKCELCKKGFFERSKLNRHLSTCHRNNNNDSDASDDPSRTCFQCKKSFSRVTGLQTHILTHHKGSRPYCCTLCNKRFSGLTALKNHEIWHEGKKNLCCDLCGKTFLLKKYLDLHLKSTHKQEDKKHFCAVCRKGFLFEKDLRRHQVSHNSVKNFSCSFCGTCFKRKDNLQRHLKLTHLLTQEQVNEVSGKFVEEEKLTAKGTHSGFNNSTIGIGADKKVHHKGTCPAEPEQVPVAPPPPPPVNQVSVIKSTHEVIMSITRGQPYM